MTNPWTPEPGADNDELGRLNAAVDDILGQPIPRTIRWADLDPQDHANALHTLGGWVQWLVTRYALDHRDTPPCWYRHGALVEELAALRGAWEVAFDPAQTANAPADWHMTFYYARLRLRDWAARTGCKTGEHRPDTTQDWAHNPDTSGWTQPFHAHLDHIVGRIDEG